MEPHNHRFAAIPQTLVHSSGPPPFGAADVPVPVLMYHSVSHAPAASTGGLSVRRAMFATHSHSYPRLYREVAA
jgi:hypothetical protein